MKITEWLEAQHKLLDGATPGPWFVIGSFNAHGISEGTHVSPLDEDGNTWRDEEWKNSQDNNFIASVRTEHERALKIIEKMREVLLSWEKCVNSGLVGSDNLAGDLALSIVIGQSISALNYFPEDGGK